MADIEIKLRVDADAAIPLRVDSPTAVGMTVSEAFIDRGGAAIQNNKNAAPSTSQVVVTPDPGYDAMEKVTVAAIPEGALAAVTPTINTSTGVVTAVAGVATSGYIADTETETGTLSIDTQAAKTVTPTTSEQTAVAAGKYTTGAVKVAAIPGEYIIPTGTKAITHSGDTDVANYATANVPAGALANPTFTLMSDGRMFAISGVSKAGYLTTSATAQALYTLDAQAAQTIYPSTSDQSIAAGKLLTGNQTIKGVLVTNLTADKIVQGETVKIGDADDDDRIMSVTGTASGGGSSGATTVASGTFVATRSSSVDVFVGKKCPKTDFIFNTWITDGTSIYPQAGTDRIFVTYQSMAQKRFAEYDLSADGNRAVTNKFTYPVYSGDTPTNRTPDERVANSACVRLTQTVSEASKLGYIKRDSTGFTMHYAGDTQHFLESGATYNWELLYIGSDPTNDIVEVP